MRRQADAIMVGAGTVRADDPSLLPRPAKGRTPWRIIIGKNVPKDAKVLTDKMAGRTLIMKGALKETLRKLGQLGVMHVLCEGGSELAGALVRADLVDKFAVFIAPALLGSNGISMLGGRGWPLTKMPTLSFQSLEKCGDDVLLIAVPEREK
jgi:diaminohydroxyphosphoribosylaminopyrimidine deaminase/5-amino-6-(5-phosphoribosylamino)uracil reductase